MFGSICTTLSELPMASTANQARRRAVPSPRPELDVFVRPREREAGDQPEAGLLDPRPIAAHRGALHDRGEHHFVVDELLDAMQRGLPAPAIKVGGLLAEEAVDVRIAAVDVGAPAG